MEFLFFLLMLLQALASAQSCTGTASSTLPAPSVAEGYEVNLVANDLTDPRGIVFDSNGHLLVVEQEVGIRALTLSDDGGSCITVSDSRMVVEDDELNHGIALSQDGTILYASSSEAAYSYPYDPMSATANTDQRQVLVQNMETTDHTTRTLLLSNKIPGMLVIARGSASNIDNDARDVSTGISQVKAFDLRNRTQPYDYQNDGLLLGWGLRNEVGIAEEPLRGGIYGVENSVDQMERDDDDVHEDNPGEELNYLGTLENNTSPNQGGNFGYPECYGAWQPEDLPRNQGINVGTQFAIGTENQDGSFNDTFCMEQRVAPRLVFQAHTAPLDIKFNDNGRQAWISFHGSWNRDNPAGYKVAMVEFENGEPVEPSTSTTAQIDVVSNQDNSQCPDNCFRPVGLAWDSRGRLFFSSDSSGEIYALRSLSGPLNNSTNTPSGTSTGEQPSESTGAASVLNAANLLSWLVVGILFYEVIA